MSVIIYCHDVTINTGYTYKHDLIWNQRRQDSNPGHPSYEAAALPTEPSLLDVLFSLIYPKYDFFLKYSENI